MITVESVYFSSQISASEISDVDNDDSWFPKSVKASSL